MVASNLMIGPDRKQELLEGDETEARLLGLLETLIQENEFIAVENEISERVHDSFERQQRRVFLHERLKVLQEELGEEGDEDSERGAYLKQLQEKKLPEAAAAAAHQGDQTAWRPSAAVGRGGRGQDLSRHGARSAVGSALGLGDPRREGGRACARRDALRPEEREGPHHRIPRGRLAEGRHAAQRHPLPGRAARGGQDLGGHGDRQGPGPAAAAHQPGRHQRRGRDPRSPSHLRRRHARPHHRRSQTRRSGRRGDRARRDRQDGGRLAGRPGGGSHGSARPGAEPLLPRQLPGARIRPLARVLHRHGELRRGHPRDAARPAGDHPPARLHRSGEAGDRSAAPGAQDRRGERLGRPRQRLHAGGAADARARLHA